MNNTSFHTSLLQPQRLGDQFEQSTKENNENEVDSFFNNQTGCDDNVNDIDTTQQRRKKHKTDVLMKKTVRKNMTKMQC